MLNDKSGFVFFGGRIFETILSEIAISAISTFLTKRFRDSSNALIWFSVFSVLIFLAWNIYCLFQYRISINTKRVYYITNFSVYALLCSISVIFSSALLIFKNASFFNLVAKVYSYTFLPFQLFYNLSDKIGININYLISSLIFSAIVLLCVFILPFLINKEKLYGKYYIR